MKQEAELRSLEIAQRLISAEGRELLAAMAAGPTAGGSGIKRRDPLVVAAGAMLELRRKAMGKLETPHRWWLTDRGLQQASSSRIATYKAQRLRELDPSTTPRWCDLCSGIGGDLVALSEHAAIVSVDRDPLLRLYQRATLDDHHRADRVEIRNVSLGEDDWSMDEFSAWHLDPDRRSESGRATRIEGFSPQADWILRQLESDRVGCLKLAPATTLESNWVLGREREWIGDDGECKQQLLWSAGTLKDSPGRRVTLLDGGHGVRSWTFDPQQAIPFRAPVAVEEGAYVWEPHAACFAAEAVASLSERLEADRVSVEGGYGVLSGAKAGDPRIELALQWGSVFRIERVESLDRRKLVRVLAEMGAGIVEWKKRGLPAEWLAKVRDLRGEGERLISALVFRGAKHVEVALGTRVVK